MTEQIYAEWYDGTGKLRLQSFPAWEDYFRATWAPDTQLVYLKDLNTGQTYTDPARPMPVR